MLTGTRRPRRVGAPGRGCRWAASPVPTLGVVVFWLSLLVLLPLAAVVGKAFDGGWDAFWDAVTSPEAAAALRLTIWLSVGVAVVNAVMGTLIAWVLVREPFRGARVLDMVIDIPFALPTIVAGLVMLALYGGSTARSAPNLVRHPHGAVRRAAVRHVAVRGAHRAAGARRAWIARWSRRRRRSVRRPAAVFRRIVLPQILPAMASGAALAFARAMGEYGSLILISSNIPFKTEIASALDLRPVAGRRARRAQHTEAAAIATVLLIVERARADPAGTDATTGARAVADLAVASVSPPTKAPPRTAAARPPANAVTHLRRAIVVL